MSNISTILDELTTAIGVIFPDKTAIPNAYSLEDNPDIYLLDGYGLEVGSETESAEGVYNQTWIDIEINITLTERIITMTGIKAAEKRMLENALLLRKDLLNFDQLGISNNIQQIKYNGHDGIEFIKSDKHNSIKVRSTFTITISEEI